MKRIFAIRTVLAIALLAMAVTIFLFSAQAGKDSSSSSSAVVGIVRGIFVPHFDSLTPAEQEQINYTLTVIVRKGAHMTEYAALAALALLNCMAWNLPRKYPFKLCASLAFSAIYATSDEIHQLFVPGRAGLFTDVLVDCGGALIGLGVVTVAVFAIRRAKNKKKHGSA